MKQSFNQIESSLRDLPITWYPKLVQTVVLEAIRKGTFLPGGATEFVRRIEAACVEMRTDNKSGQ